MWSLPVRGASSPSPAWRHFPGSRAPKAGWSSRGAVPACAAPPVFLENPEIRRCDLCGRRRASDGSALGPRLRAFLGRRGSGGGQPPAASAAKLESDSEGARRALAPSKQPAQCSSHLRRKRRFELCSRTRSAIARWLPRCAPRGAASSARRAVFPKRLLHTKGLRFKQAEVQILEHQFAER